MNHAILLGDSVFDNARYVPFREDAVEEQLRRRLHGWRVTLLAQDGATTGEIGRQLERLPEAATHLVLGVGGNNALDFSGFIRQDSASSMADALNKLEEIRTQFVRDYRQSLRSVVAQGKPTAVCTIYDAIPDL